MVHLGDESNDIWWSIYDGSVWRKPDGTAGNVRIPGQQSKASPALASFGGIMYMLHLGDSSKHIWLSAYEGALWRKSDGTAGNEQIVGQESKAAPAIAGHELALRLVHLGDTSNNIWYSIKRHLLIDWEPNFKIGLSSRARPSLAAIFTQQDSALHMVYQAVVGNGILHTSLTN
jgi:hypothetical protein